VLFSKLVCSLVVVVDAVTESQKEKAVKKYLA
jgi:hypothetical protein